MLVFKLKINNFEAKEQTLIPLSKCPTKATEEVEREI